MINWLIEEFSRDNSFLDIRDAAQARGHNVKIVESIPFFYDPHWSLFPEGSTTVFLGSIQCAKQIQREWKRHKWNPAVWITWNNYCCHMYYAYWGKWVFNQKYLLLPLSEFIRHIDDIRSYFNSESLFIRPNGGDKAFTGQVFTAEDYKSKLWEISVEDMKPEDLLLVSNPKLIEREWRVVCANKEVITGSRYKTSGVTDYRRELPDDVKDFVQKIIICSGWEPDPIYVVDVCRDHCGRLWLLEIGAFNVAGLYHCEFDKIVIKVEEITSLLC